MISRRRSKVFLSILIPGPLMQPWLQKSGSMRAYLESRASA